LLAVQRLASRVVAEVLAGASLAECLPRALREAAAPPSTERAALQDLSYGTLRHLGEINFYLDALLSRPLSDAPLRALLQVAIYQLAHTRAAAYAVVDQAVEAAMSLGFASARGLVNAVLRNFLRQRDALEARAARDEVAHYSHPRWWIERLRREYPRDWAGVLEAGNTHPPLALRVNARRTSRDECLAELAAAGIAARPSGPLALTLEAPVPVERIPGFSGGRVSVQDAGAQLAAPLLGLAPGQRVLDACAAPGGKAAHILETAAVELLALDSDGARLQRVRENFARLGLEGTIACADAVRVGDWWDGRAFDRVLADVPCTASGVVRRHPDIKWLRRESDIERFAARQEALLDALWQVVAGGGRLLYATCSVFAEENGNRVARFLERHPDARIQPLPGLRGTAEAPAGQLLPDHQHDGFYYALLEKL
jgi:16S rRNA (cytosine967-C5)-methyltransferase